MGRGALLRSFRLHAGAWLRGLSSSAEFLDHIRDMPVELVRALEHRVMTRVFHDNGVETGFDIPGRVDVGWK